MNSKIVTIEEVQEINIAHQNWSALVSRESYGTGDDTSGEVGLFQLVKATMRMRPDILVVGEVRGEEAYVLFQAISTGHGGLCTLHADDVTSAIQRLTSKPMDVPPSFIPFLDLVFTVRRISVPIPGGGFRTMRRVLSVDEVVSVGNYVRMFKWDPGSDKQFASPMKTSVKLARLAQGHRHLGSGPHDGDREEEHRLEMGAAEGGPQLQRALPGLRGVQGALERNLREGARGPGQGRARDAGGDARRVQALSQVSQLGQLETKRQAKESSKLSFFDKMTATAYKMFGTQGKKFAASSPEMRDQILKSNLRITPEALVSLAMFSTVLDHNPVVVCVVLGLLLHVIFLFLVVIAPPIVFVLIWNLPKASASSRSEGIENELPMLIGFLGVLSGGGVSPISTLRRISGMTKVFPASAKEAKRILVDIDVFGTDPITAFETAAKYMPNKSFAEFLYGYTTVLKVGGDVKNYVNNKLKETLDQSTSKVRRITDSVGTLAEAYLTVTAVMGITLFSLFQLEGVIAHNNSGLQTLFIFSYLVVPALSGLFIFIIDGTQPKQPYFNKRPYYVLGACMPIGLALFLIPLPLQLSIHVSP